jgi:hypothetical protein
MKGLSTLKAVSVAAMFVLVALASRPAMAAPILGGQLSYSGGDVTITTLPVSSGYTSELRLYNSSLVQLTGGLVMDEPEGQTVTFDPGTLGVAVGDELVFGIYVYDTGDIFYMGPAARNLDNVLHASVEGPNVVTPYGTGYVVGFEDLYGGGDWDYNDNRFLFEGGVERVPEPSLLALFALGAGGLKMVRRRRA